MKCPRCGTENSDDRIYCWKCMAPLKSGAMGVIPTAPEREGRLATPTAPSVPVTRKAEGKRAKIILIPLALLLVLAAGVGFVAFINSPQQVAQKWANALARQDEASLKKLVAAKDQQRLSGLIGITKMFSDMSAQLAGIEDRQGQKVAKVAINFSQISFGGLNLKFKGSIQLPFVLVRERFVFWRVDLEKSESLMVEEAKRMMAEMRKAFLEAAKQNPALQQLLQFLPQR